MRTIDLPSRSLVFVLCALGVWGAAASGRAQDEPVVAGQGGIAAPKRTKTVPPVYPPEALAKGIRGIVILEIVIDKEGKVAAADVIRSLPPLDDAALSAVRKWEYEVTKVDGKPVSVRLTVPITFALKLPELTRQEGIPELRQGAPVGLPAGAELREPTTVTAEVTLDPDGTVAEAEVVKGAAPWSATLLQALRTWRFASEGGNAVLSFRVEAEFLPATKGGPARVDLRLNGLRRSEAVADHTAVASTAAPAGPAAATPAAPATGEPASPPSPAPEKNAATPPPASSAPPQTEPTSTPPPTSLPATPAAEPPAAITAKAPPTQPVPSNPPAAAAPEATEKEAKPTPAPPPVEVITAPPSAAAAGGAPAPPPTPGISAIRDVTLDVGVPDLTRGHRPAPPPLARMGGVTGVVEVRFSVDAAGQTLVQGADGPDLLKPAAQDMVSSWVFRRTTAERLRLVAEVTYVTDAASAKVRSE
jgi:TonB family protein